MESKRLAGKTALVTAAASGIGRASAESFALAGARVLAVDIDAKAVQGVAGCEGHVLDLRDTTAISEFAARVGKIDVLFNCAGMVPKGTVLDVDFETWKAAFDLNVHSMYHLIRAFLPGMVAARAGSIINMSSVASSITGVPDRCGYGATKAAVIGLTKAIGKDVARNGVIVNCVAPAVIETPILDGITQEHIDYMVERIPMGRMGEAEEVAALICWLASEECSFSTGATYDISGGRAVY